jgi:hypothetical protein
VLKNRRNQVEECLVVSGHWRGVVVMTGSKDRLAATATVSGTARE